VFGGVLSSAGIVGSRRVGWFSRVRVYIGVRGTGRRRILRLLWLLGLLLLLLLLLMLMLLLLLLLRRHGRGRE